MLILMILKRRDEEFHNNGFCPRNPEGISVHFVERFQKCLIVFGVSWCLGKL